MISTHILDTHLGDPASGISVVLKRQKADQMEQVSSGTTNEDGRVEFDCPREPGIYHLVFDVSVYFKKNNTPAFYTQIPVVFSIQDTNRKYHVPLLLNPYGYSTYRGS